MSTPLLGEIRMFAGNFAPHGWALCNGQLLPIASNSALFALLGTTYGGNGTTNFALPDLRGRVPMHWGNGSGLSPRVIGEQTGTETVTLLSTQIPAHVHTVRGASTAGTHSAPPADGFLAASDRRDNQFTTTADTNMGATNATGGSQPHANMQPSLAVTFIIALQGIFPSRN